MLKGAMNGEAFLAYVEQCLAPTLKRGPRLLPAEVQRRLFPQERHDPSFSHGRLFGNGQERGNWPQVQFVLQRWRS